jgi:tetratricopeptide (TPR) repeat protein
MSLSDYRATRSNGPTELQSKTPRIVMPEGCNHMTTPPLEVRLFATEPVVRQDGETLSFSRRDALHLLIYLLLEQQEIYDRAKLASLFFEKDGSTEKQRSRLRVVVHEMRHVLGDAFVPQEAKADVKKLAFNHAAVWLDTAEFKRRAQMLLNTGEQTATFVQEAEQTLGLYRDHFLRDYDLGGSDEVLLWQEAQRAQLAELRHRLLEQVVRYYIKQGNLNDAHATAETWLASLEPGALPLQYLLWLSLKRRQHTPLEKYLDLLREHEANDAIRFGYTAAEWRRYIESGEDTLPSLLNLPTGMTGNAAPVPLEGFVGRDETVREFTHLLLDLDQPRVLGVTGLPGVGKSVFARQLVYQLSQHKPKYDIARIELNPDSDFELLLNDVLKQLGMEALVAQPYTSKQRRFRQILQVRPCLILVDEGLSHRLATASFLESLLNLFEGARLLLLARRLPEVEFYTFELPGLEGAHIRAFLAHHLPDLASAINDSHLRAFTETTGGLPLVLQLATGFLRHQRFNSIGSFTHALSDLSAESWTAADAPFLYSRLLDWFWKLLTPDEQQLVAIASLFDFAGGSPETDVVEIARAALNFRADTARRKLAALGELGVIQRREQAGTTRYNLHPMVYDYAQSRREREHTPAMAAIHAAYSRHMVDYVTMHAEDYARLDAQKDNVIRMFATALADFSAPDFQGEMVALLNRVYDYFDRRGLYIVAEQLLQAAKKVERVSDFDRVKLVFNLGQAAFKQGRMDDAEQLFNEAWEHAQDCGFIELYGEILRDLGRVSFHKGDYERAVQYLKQGGDYALEKNQPLLHGQIMANIGVVEDLKGHYNEAKTRFMQILHNLDAENRGKDSYVYLDIEQFVENMLGLIAVNLEDFSSGEIHLQKSLQIARQLNNPERIARSYVNLGVLSYNRGQFGTALDYFAQGTIVAEYIQHQDTLAWLSFNMGAIRVIQHQYSPARKLLWTALNIINDLGLKTLLPYVSLWFGILHFEQAQLSLAHRYFSSILEQRALNPWFAATALYGIALIARYDQDILMQADWERIRNQVSAALDAIHINKAQLPAFQKGDLEKAEADFQRALSDIPEIGRFQIVDAVWLWWLGVL